MSSADHKRKASLSETTNEHTSNGITGQTSAQVQGEEQPVSKKARVEQDVTDEDKDEHDKDDNVREGHSADCNDSSCEGCAEGEIELQFDTKPTAMELFQMAREEASKESAENYGAGAAKKLFDMAIEEFEALEKANSHLEMSDDPKSE
ncbi:hypothetical protein BGZ94_008152, partial [Podila epigama]